MQRSCIFEAQSCVKSDLGEAEHADFGEQEKIKRSHCDNAGGTVNNNSEPALRNSTLFTAQDILSQHLGGAIDKPCQPDSQQPGTSGDLNENMTRWLGDSPVDEESSVEDSSDDRIEDSSNIEDFSDDDDDKAPPDFTRVPAKSYSDSGSSSEYDTDSDSMVTDYKGKGRGKSEGHLSGQGQAFTTSDGTCSDVLAPLSAPTLPSQPRVCVNPVNFVWESFDGLHGNASAKDHPFTAKTGVADWVLALKPKTPNDFFRIFWDNSIMTHVMRETNRYAREQHPPSTKWTPLNSARFDAFIGVNIAQGLSHRDDQRDYWSRKPLWYTPWYGEMFSVNDFERINQNLHCCNSALHNSDALFKVRYILEKAQQNFKRAYTPAPQLRVLQYVAQKPTKHGVKVWMLAECKTGYCTRFQISTGRVKGAVGGEPPLHVIRTLSSDIRNLGYYIYFDNIYTSPAICLDLLQNGILSCGTVRANRRGVPDELKSAKHDGFQSGDMVFRKCGNLVAVRWKDERDITMLSTIHGNKVKESNGMREPTMICDYSKYVRRAYLLHQMLYYYTLGRYTVSWWKQLFWRVVELCVVNAYVLYKAVTGEKIDHSEFRGQLIIALTEPLRNRRLRDISRRGRLPSERLVHSPYSPIPSVAVRTSGTRRTYRVGGRKRNAKGKPFQKKT